MKRTLSLVVVMALIFSVMSFPIMASATGSETPTEKVHFDWDFEDYKETNDRLPKSTVGEYGTFTTPIAGGVKKDWDGNASMQWLRWVNPRTGRSTSARF